MFPHVSSTHVSSNGSKMFPSQCYVTLKSPDKDKFTLQVKQDEARDLKDRIVVDALEMDLPSLKLEAQDAIRLANLFQPELGSPKRKLPLIKFVDAIFAEDHRHLVLPELVSHLK